MINILYEDNHLLVVEKEVNMPVCKDRSQDKDLLSILKEYIKEKYQKPGNVYLGLIHRLDRPVGGVMVFAKTSKAASRLSKQVKNHEFEKQYYAVAEGKLACPKGKYEDYLVKDERTNISRVDKQGKLAILEYEVISYKENKSLIHIWLQTGRSHQIRVQFSHHGNSLIGDQKYSNTQEKVPVALFAYHLSFLHPITKERLTFELPLPNRYPWSIFIKKQEKKDKTEQISIKYVLK